MAVVGLIVTACASLSVSYSLSVSLSLSFYSLSHVRMLTNEYMGVEMANIDLSSIIIVTLLLRNLYSFKVYKRKIVIIYSK